MMLIGLQPPHPLTRLDAGFVTSPHRGEVGVASGLKVGATTEEGCQPNGVSNTG